MSLTRCTNALHGAATAGTEPALLAPGPAGVASERQVAVGGAAPAVARSQEAARPARVGSLNRIVRGAARGGAGSLFLVLLLKGGPEATAPLAVWMVGDLLPGPLGTAHSWVTSAVLSLAMVEAPVLVPVIVAGAAAGSALAARSAGPAAPQLRSKL
jgi:hypothetical protein